MSQMMKFISLYADFGIELKAEPADKYDIDKDPQVAFTIELEQGSHPKFIGYSGFCSGLTFDKDGNFLSQGFWE